MSGPSPFFINKRRYGAPAYAGLMDLPVELIHYIFLLARDPTLPLVSKALLCILSPRQVPASVKVDYLLACWHDAYAYGFDDPQSHPASGSIQDARTFEQSLKQLGHISEREAMLLMKLRDPYSALVWNGEMLPVNVPWYPRFVARRATHRVTDYVLRYPICDDTVFARLEQKVLRLREFGNICFTTGLDPRAMPPPLRAEAQQDAAQAEQQQQQQVEEDPCASSSSHPNLNPKSLGERGGYFSFEGVELDRSTIASRRQPGIVPKPRSLIVTELPKRLFRSFPPAEEPFPSRVDPNGAHSRYLPISQTPNRGSPQPGAFAASTEQKQVRSHDDETIEQLYAILKPFGPPPYMATGHLLLLLRLLCVNSSSGFDRPDQALLNSHDGYPLARATLAQCQPIVRLLLFFGATPQAKGNLSVLIAIRAGWLKGVKTLVDALPCRLLTECQNLTRVVNSWIAARDAVTLKLSTGSEEARRQLAFNPAWIESEKRFMTPIEHMPLLGHTRPAIAGPSASSMREQIVKDAVTQANDEDVLFTVALMDQGPQYMSDDEDEGSFDIPQVIINPRMQARCNVVPDADMLFEAVKARKWDVVDWLRDKKDVAPDMRTIGLLEKLEKEGEKQEPKKKKRRMKRT